MALGIEISGRTKCPCGSGKAYAQCCKSRNFKFVRDKNGNVFQQVPMYPEVFKALKNEEQLFRKILGRKPIGDDPVFLEKYEQSPEEIHAAVMDAMEEANIRPELQYAYQKTGLIVSEDTASLMPEKDVEEFYDAIDEYYQLKAQRKLPGSELRKNPLFKTWTDLFILKKLCVVTYGMFLEKIQNRCTLEAPLFLQVFFISRSLHVFRTVARLLDEDVGDDGLILVRCMYENFLRIAFLRKVPQSASGMFAIAGLAAGTHQYEVTKRGKINRRTIVDSKTEEKFKVHVPYSEMARASDYPDEEELFHFIYDFLSGQAHDCLKNVRAYFKFEEGFVAHREDDPLGCLWHVMFVNALTFDEMRFLPGVDKIMHRDLLRVSNKLRKLLLYLIESKIRDEGATVSLGFLEKRVKFVGRRRKTFRSPKVRSGK